MVGAAARLLVPGACPKAETGVWKHYSLRKRPSVRFIGEGVPFEPEQPGAAFDDRGGRLAQFGDQARFAKTGLATQGDYLALALAQLDDGPTQSVQLGITADER